MFYSESIKKLTLSSYWSVPRIALDLLLWVTAAFMAQQLDTWWAYSLAILFIGAVPMHDILFHGHEGAHRRISRISWLNEIFNWFCHALYGLSSSGYRKFHLEHHRLTHTDQDPEFRLMNRIAKGAPGWSWLLAPLFSYLAMNVWPFQAKGALKLKKQVALELIATLLLHVVLCLSLGTVYYLLFVLLPAILILWPTASLRSLCEHHATESHNPWTHSRGMVVHPILSFLWSNANYHLEHHLCPSVPFHKLPEVRRLLSQNYQEQQSPLDQGYIKTGWRLFREKGHFMKSTNTKPLVRKNSQSFRMRVRLFQDILQCAKARQHIWSVYYTGEAYEEIHPQGVYVDKLPPKWGRLLERHLNDETRHAEVFQRLLTEEKTSPKKLAPIEDVGWHCLTQVVPEVVAKGKTHEPFQDEETQRYMAFLHSLELRSISDLLALREAAKRLGKETLAQDIQKILQDEQFHASYTLAAVYELAPSVQQAQKVLTQVLRAERKAYTQSLQHIFQQIRALGSTPPGIKNKIRWAVMGLLVKSGVAFQRLPLYKRLSNPLCD